VRLTAHWGGWLWPLGALAIAAKFAGAYALATAALAPLAAVFNSPALNWLGLITRLPVTEDYVPLLPWLGLIWWGAATGNWLMRGGMRHLTRTLPATLNPLASLGRWSLSYYMLHQPVLIGALMALAWLAK